MLVELVGRRLPYHDRRDVLPEALSIAKERLAASPVGDRVELRQQSVVDLFEVDAFDLAWLPQIFMSPQDLRLGIGRVHAALRAGCWLVMPVAAHAPKAMPSFLYISFTSRSTSLISGDASPFRELMMMGETAAGSSSGR